MTAHDNNISWTSQLVDWIGQGAKTYIHIYTIIYVCITFFKKRKEKVPHLYQEFGKLYVQIMKVGNYNLIWVTFPINFHSISELMVQKVWFVLIYIYTKVQGWSVAVAIGVTGDRRHVTFVMTHNALPMTHDINEIFSLFFSVLFDICATIRTRQEIQCLPYAGFKIWGYL